ncbi:ATP-binding cassette domain-containing protein [Halomonas heilongjiangensis]|uniref:ABC transporter ATP-binding protein n=1 Tax=Halomonas heilongjiangensis TaxID=1387883 RepID=A0A2N7TGT6_9GAMM|nr:ATP-binding cassette domain-containing protein [Halomonas heilongjiangensis]PMR67393.1 ABC transporter ATP-binding protein [Halomonas heilongjiangensis]PXX91151.1 ABC transporter ATP-binding protein [Halomonas heilongjiangensis]
MSGPLASESGALPRRGEGDLALQVSDLSFAYGDTPVLEAVSLAIPAGEFAVLLGPNGAGKTTLFSLITRLHDRRRGEIRIGGFDVRRQAVQAHARIGVVFQQPTLDLDLSVAQNLAYHGALHGMAPRQARARAEAQLARVGLAEQRRTRVRQLSGGQRRRVEIARGLLHAPRLLLLDEPTVGLDIASRRDLVEHAHRLCREEGVAVLWATHLIDEVRPGDRVLVLHRGRLLADDRAEELIARLGVDTLGEAFDRLVAEGEAPCA